MSKRGKSNRDGEEWLEQVTSDRQEIYYRGKPFKWWPVGMKRRGPKVEPVGDRKIGFVNLVTGTIILSATFVSVYLNIKDGNIFDALFSFIVLLPVSLIFLRAAIENFRYSK